MKTDEATIRAALEAATPWPWENDGIDRFTADSGYVHVIQGSWETKTCPVHGVFEGSHHWCPYMEPYVGLESASPAEAE